MGRHPKVVPAADGTDRREAGFYRTPGFLARYVAHRLRTEEPDLRSVFDPCVGDGAFLRPFRDAGVRLHGMDVVDHPRPAGVRFRDGDFLEHYRDWRARGAPPPPHDAYVVNPPYNCHEAAYIRQRKAPLQALFPDIGVYNLYALFLAATLDMARPGAQLAWLTLDSFLTARAHAPLRRRIRERLELRELILCPTDLFADQGADVRTCLIIGRKRAAARKVPGGGADPRAGTPRPSGQPAPPPVRVLDRPLSTEALRERLARGDLEPVPVERLVLDGPADRGELVVGLPEPLRRLFQQPRLGERYRCFTGISTGNDRRYLRSEPSAGHAVPFYKNPGRKRFWCPPDAYLPDDYERIAQRVPNFMVRNRQWLRKEGLVCSSMGVPFGACHRPAESTFGVNANVRAPAADRWWLLAYLNSSLVTYLVRGVLARSNMVTAGYVARIPVPLLSPETRQRLARQARQAWRKRVGAEEALAWVVRIDQRLHAELELPPETRDHLQRFSRELLKRT